MKWIVVCLVALLLVQTGFFIIRDSVSATVSGLDRFAEIALLLMFIALFFYSRYPRTSMLFCGICAVGIGLNLERHTNDHSISGILARNLLMILFFIVGALGFPRQDEDDSKAVSH